MQHEIIISGFGGQGALFAGQLLAYGALAEGRHVTWIPSYGPEMRGGTANCTVIISDEEIGSPLVRHPTAALVMNPPSFDRFEPALAKNGVLITNASLIATTSARADIREIAIRANEMATEIGAAQMANVIMVGALIQATGALKLETLDRVLDERISARHRDKLEMNKQALRRGAELARA
ncbi:2-oxoglutarate ferredoxin oxidoreductase subunit gamma [Anaerolineae bacterium]|nr:2-oxoglutarate ferredoxin oxidoreductase subunit gamma [Anaerolineae bacterium]